LKDNTESQEGFPHNILGSINLQNTHQNKGDIYLIRRSFKGREGLGCVQGKCNVVNTLAGEIAPLDLLRCVHVSHEFMAVFDWADQKFWSVF
jgi:hypothetical protein